VPAIVGEEVARDVAAESADVFDASFPVRVSY
jgi:hypothetical protein